METPTFDLLTPRVVLAAVEAAFELKLDGTLTSFPSYINRVYGLNTEDGTAYVAKFYRPGRWRADSIQEEHDFVRECQEAELPVVAPEAAPDGSTLLTVTAAAPEREQEFDFALFQKRSGRNFDADRDEDWLRLGRLVGRLHTVAVAGTMRHRLRWTPQEATVGFIQELIQSDAVHPDLEPEFRNVTDDAISLINPFFANVELQRLHGDCHRGNILDRPEEGLLIVDFDDAMLGPAVQDLWFLLPGSAAESRLELNLIIEGYQEFRPFARETLALIEPLRFMRMVYYLAWSARQRLDLWFKQNYPHWGSRAFWITQVEDLRTQLEIVRSAEGRL